MLLASHWFHVHQPAISPVLVRAMVADVFLVYSVGINGKNPNDDPQVREESFKSLMESIAWQRIKSWESSWLWLNEEVKVDEWGHWPDPMIAKKAVVSVGEVGPESKEPSTSFTKDQLINFLPSKLQQTLFWVRVLTHPYLLYILGILLVSPCLRTGAYLPACLRTEAYNSS